MSGPVLALLETWEARSRDALPADAMLINKHVRELREALAPETVEALTESDKDVALGQAVEFAAYVERQAKGTMRDAAKRFLSLPYAQEIAARLATVGARR